MKEKICYSIAMLVPALAALYSGCTDDQTAAGDQQNEVQIVQTNAVPVRLAAKSYTFTVTANQNLAEPFNSDYTIDFNSETSYTLHPTPQNSEALVDRHGSYTYDARSGVTHFVESAPSSGRTIDAVLTFTSATTGTAHLTGRNGESQDAIFVQTAP